MELYFARHGDTDANYDAIDSLKQRYENSKPTLWLKRSSEYLPSQ